MTMTNRKMTAFSLIEVMVAFAIVLIISITAYPVLSHYLVQSKVAEAINSAGAVKVMINNQIANLGTVTNSGLNLDTPTTISDYVSGYTVSDDGVISITTTAAAGGISFTLTPSYDATADQVRWTCAVSDAAANDSVPSECRI